MNVENYNRRAPPQKGWTFKPPRSDANAASFNVKLCLCSAKIMEHLRNIPRKSALKRKALFSILLAISF